MKNFKSVVMAAALILLSTTQASAQMEGPFNARIFSNHTVISPSAAGVGEIANVVGFNHESQVAVECVSSYGTTYAGAACVTARLTADELNKCFTDGIGGRGCFGDNNTLVSLVRQNMEAASRESGAVNQTIRATTGISIKDIEDNNIFGGSNSFFNCPFGGC